MAIRASPFLIPSLTETTIGVSEISGKYIDGEFVKTPMPREVIEMMIEKWKVRSLRETIYIENQSNLRVDVELFTRLNKSHFDRCSSFFADAPFDYDGRVHSCEIEDSPIRRVFQRFEEKSFQQGINLGKRVTYKGKTNNSVINLDVLA
uniref:Phage portal protein n=1 Tax=Caenorhabditis tropicalis TaxID=1561998 RepID=A0A1I7V4G1_9PELO